MKNGQVPGRKEPACNKWWTKRSKTEKRLVFATTISAMLLLLILLVYLIISNGPKVCESSACVRTSLELLNFIDEKVDPCEDFYRFACGKFLQNTDLDNRTGSRSLRSITADEIQSQIKNMLEQPVQSQDPVAFNLAKKFYRACMNESAIEASGLEGMKQIFEKIGGWPTVNGHNWRESQFDWKDAVHKLREIGINFEFFLILSTQRDKGDPTRYILNLKDPSYSPSVISRNIKEMYLDYMVDVAVMFGANQERARREQQEVMQLLLKLAKISEEAKAANKTGQHNSPRSLSELQYEFPSVPWHEYINKILAPASEITYDDVVYVSEPLYLKKLLSLLQTTSKRVLANFMAWHTLQHLTNYLPEKVLERAYRYLKQVGGNPTKHPRWSMCVDSAQTRLNGAISAGYFARYFDDSVRHHVLDIVRNIKYRFAEDLLQLDWLDRETKDMAHGKVVASVEDIPTYDNLVEENGFYEDVQISEDNLLSAVLNLDYVNTNIQFQWLRQGTAKRSFLEKPGFVTGVNIEYSPRENALKLPLGIFQGTFYQKDRPDYMNYGALGTIIAHEIYHIIIQAENRDLQGGLRSWWSSRSLLNYEEKLQCLSRRYGIAIASESETPNGTVSGDEDMADLAGMKVSYDTYINWVQENKAEPRLPGLNYSPNQLFWISSAIHHCAKYSAQTLQRYIANYQQSPGQLRVNGALQNLEEFAFDFRCPEGSNMNPEYKCRVW